MASLKLFMALLVIIAVCELGFVAGCNDRSSLVLSKKRTRRLVQGQPEYQVTLTNTCYCSQGMIKLACASLNSVEPIDPKILQPMDDGTCGVINGDYISGGDTITFNYAQAIEVDFKILFNQIACS